MYMNIKSEPLRAMLLMFHICILEGLEANTYFKLPISLFNRVKDDNSG